MATDTGSPWNLPYPEDDDDVRPYEDIRILAEEVHAQLTVVDSASQNPPTCQVRRNANQAITTGGVPQALSFDVEDVDNDTMYTSGTPTTVTIKTAGRYSVHGSVVWALNATAERVLALFLNGTEIVGGSTPGSSANAIRQNLSEERVFAVSDAVTLRAYQNSGSSVNLVGRLTVRRVGDV
jgi:hypothetical protein